MVTKEEKARQLLHAMTEIEDRYIAEAAPENTEHSAASEEAVKSETVVPMKHADVEKTDVPDEDHHSEPKVLYMKPQKRWKPMGIIAAAAVLVIGFGAYMKTEKASNSMAPVAFIAGAESEMARAVEDGQKSAAAADAPMSMQIANPWSEFDTLEEAESDAGIEIELPESYQGFNHRIYRSMHRQMIEVIYQDADGREGFRIRKSRDFGDISGDYTRYDQEKTLEIGDRFVETRGNGDEIFVARWGNLSLNLSYAICVAEDQHFTEDDIRSLVEDIDPDIRETGTTRRKSDVFQPDPDAETIDPAKQPLY